MHQKYSKLFPMSSLFLNLSSWTKIPSVKTWQARAKHSTVNKDISWYIPVLQKLIFSFCIWTFQGVYHWPLSVPVLRRSGDQRRRHTDVWRRPVVCSDWRHRPVGPPASERPERSHLCWMFWGEDDGILQSAKVNPKNDEENTHILFLS